MSPERTTWTGSEKRRTTRSGEAPRRASGAGDAPASVACAAALATGTANASAARVTSVSARRRRRRRRVAAPAGSGGFGGSGGRRGTGGSLRSLVGFALRPARFDALARAVRAPVLVVHAADDHHVPVDFALAAETESFDTDDLRGNVARFLKRSSG